MVFIIINYLLANILLTWYATCKDWKVDGIVWHTYFKRNVVWKIYQKRRCFEGVALKQGAANKMRDLYNFLQKLPPLFSL